jgi:large subunit ribosomal protein L10
MENPRPEKVAVVTEVRQRFEEADAALLTEYRGISMSGMQVLRRALRDAGGDYKIYKNTLVRIAARDLGLDVEALLTGPTAIAFVAPGPDGKAGDPVLVAKALKEFAKTDPNLVVKGGILGERVLSADDASALADVAPREELLARLAGGLAAPMQQFAALLNAVPAKFAYALQALVDAGGGPGAAAAEAATPPPTPAEPADAAPAAEADVPQTEASEAPAAAAETAEAPAEATDNSEASSDAEPTPEES